MYTIYKIKAEELDNRFVRALKTLFKNKEIEIAVSEASANEDDETAYLLKSPANRERLLKALDNVSNNRNLVTVNLDEIQ
jgi:antitoxin YefM